MQLGTLTYIYSGEEPLRRNLNSIADDLEFAERLFKNKHGR